MTAPNLWLQVRNARSALIARAVFESRMAACGQRIPRAALPLRDHPSIRDALTWATCCVALWEAWL